MITSYTTTRSGNFTTVTVTSSLSAPVYYFWYTDTYVGMTQRPSKTFYVAPGQQLRVACVDSNNPAFDPIANSAAQPSGRRTVSWVRSLDPRTVRYAVQQRVNGGSYSTIAWVAADASTWQYNFTTPQLTDLSVYGWQIVPYDSAGNAGTAITVALTEEVVCVPPSPVFAVSFSPSTLKVTFAA